VGVRLRVVGLERLDPQNLHVYANHQSLIDVAIFWICLGRNVAYLAKKELTRNRSCDTVSP